MTLSNEAQVAVLAARSAVADGRDVGPNTAAVLLAELERRSSPTDPRRPGGDIAGPRGPYERHGAVVDLTDAVLMDHIDVSLIEPDPGSGRSPAIALMLGGRINKTDERASILFFFDPDGAGAIVAELMALFDRAAFAPDTKVEFIASIERRLDEMATKAPGGAEHG